MGIVPGEPTDVVVTEATKSYVVLAWKPPTQRGHEGVMYYIEKVTFYFLQFSASIYVANFHVVIDCLLWTTVYFRDRHLAEGEY